MTDAKAYSPKRMFPLLLIMLSGFSFVWGAREVAGQDRGKADWRVDYRFITQLASSEDVIADPFLGKQRIAVHKDANVLMVDLAPTATKYITSASDPLAVPLEAAIRLNVLRRDAAVAFPGDGSWPPLFSAVESSIGACVQSIDTAAGQGGGQMTAACDRIELAFGPVADALKLYAKSHQMEEAKERGLSSGYRVKLVVSPPSARVKVMTALEYRECVYRHLPQDEAFVDLLGDEAELIGRYHYRVEWPKELGGPDEGNFEIQGNSTLHFTPKKM